MLNYRHRKNVVTCAKKYFLAQLDVTKRDRLQSDPNFITYIQKESKNINTMIFMYTITHL